MRAVRESSVKMRGVFCVCVKVQDLGFVRVAVSGDFVCEE